MLLDALKLFSLGVNSWWQNQSLLQNFSVHVSIAAVLSLLYLIWRLWAFAIWPKFHLADPRDIPYWIPGA